MLNDVDKRKSSNVDRRHLRDCLSIDVGAIALVQTRAKGRGGDVLAVCHCAGCFRKDLRFGDGEFDSRGVEKLFAGESSIEISSILYLQAARGPQSFSLSTR